MRASQAAGTVERITVRIEMVKTPGVASGRLVWASVPGGTRGVGWVMVECFGSKL